MASESDKALSPRVLETLAHVAHLFASGIDSIEEAFHYVLKATVDLTSANFGTIWLYDDETHRLLIRVTLGLPHDLLKKTFTADDGIAGRVLRTATSHLVSDVTKDPDYVELFPKAKSEVVVPIKYRSEVVGVLSLVSTAANHFTLEQLTIVELLTSILASTLEKEEIKHLRTQVELTKREPNAETAFVLTPFREPFNKYYSAIIKPAVQSTGLVSLRADEIFAPTEIIQDIWAAINKAKVIIAELTTRNPNVMYELGLSHAVNKPVIS